MKPADVASPGGARKRVSTATSNFGAGGRESHDASGFYDRFRSPDLSSDDTVLVPAAVDEPFVLGDARRMDRIADGSVALVVTSPPYFAGKQYEEELEREGVPASYLEFLQMLTDVFAECVRTLEPGGRIAVNVANLGRKPYRSLSADVIRILQHDLGLLLRGELIWQKGEGASGSCAWGSFRGAANPVLRDISERIIVASKGRFDRAQPPRLRAREGLPSVTTIMTDDFLRSTLDIWSMPTERATRVGHPAPFPVELPERLIRLYTFEDDLVLDPFMGSGSSLVAAARLGRRYIGYDLDPSYVEIARRRVAAALVKEPPTLFGAIPADRRDLEAAAIAAGTSASRLAEDAITAAGFSISGRKQRIRRTGAVVRFVATDEGGQEWMFDVVGQFTSRRGGMQQVDAVWKALGKAHAIRGCQEQGGDRVPYVLLTTHLPKQSSEAATALRAAGPQAFFDAIEVLSGQDLERLRRYATGGHTGTAAIGFWTADDLAQCRADSTAAQTVVTISSRD
ncbi:MAG: site-specific DNA-methyltransferase [Ilumatobacteraceae bacterium]